MKRTIVAAAAMSLLAGCGSGAQAAPTTTAPTGPATFSIYGQIKVGDAYILGKTGCTSAGGYEDVVEGTAVVVKDAKGTQVALGRLEAGTLAPGSTDTFAECIYKFRVAEVPESDGLYTVEVGSRGGATYSRNDLVGDLDLTLG